MHGSYIGAVANDENGTPFGDVIGELESLIDGPKLVQALESGLGSANANYYRVNIEIAAKRTGTSLGIMDASFALSGIFSPMITGYFVDMTHHFATGFIILAILAAISVVMIVFFHRPDQEKPLVI